MSKTLLTELKKAEASGGHYMLSLAEVRDVIDTLSRATTQIDVEGIKREVIDVNGFCDIDSSVSDADIRAVVSTTLDYLAAQYDFVPKNGGKK